mgnify:FL=1|tara:strand:- start:553 stop:810 length:258 start_codon:yes stop_codon:yes gene_type:complete
MITKHTTRYNSPWTILEFEKRGVTIIYNARTKDYEFYKYAPKSKAKSVTRDDKVVKMSPAMIAVLILGGALGVSLAFNIANIIFF